VTAAARGAVREAIDAARRAQIDWSREPRCSGCGVELHDPISELPRYVAGCASCTDRKLQRSRRISPQLVLQVAA
jgi:hypothetical protein